MQGKSHRRDVLFVPDWTLYNAYQNLLAESLISAGNDVRFGAFARRWSVLREVRATRLPDVLHVHWPDPYIFGQEVLSGRKELIMNGISFLIEILWLKMRGVKVVWTVHDLCSHDSRYCDYERFFLKLLVRVSDRIVVHSNHAKKLVTERYSISSSQAKKMHVIPLGHYMHRYKNTVSREQARARLDIPPDETVFLYFGLVRCYKGVEDLLDAFQELNPAKSILLIVGLALEESYRDFLKQKYGADSRIRFVLEFVPDDDIQLYFNASDCVVLPYRRILTSSTLMLVLSFARPVVVPAFECIAEVLNGEGNIMYNPDSPNALRTALREALKMDYKEVGNMNLALAQSEPYQWSTIADQYTSVYRT
ncbi:MAG: glycosyltransferase [Candidatus Auribacterota bacterium]